MPTPQETRFVRLAVTRHALSKEQMDSCLEFQDQKLNQGSKISLWDCSVLMGLLDEADAERLAGKAGDLPVGKLGEYIVLEKLGEGGMGAVYLAIGPDKQRAAVKVLPPQLAKQRQFLSRFFREAQACCKLRHQNVVCGFKVGEEVGHYYFAMEFVDGTSVDEMLEKEGPIPPEKATELILQVAQGLAYAHENGIIHRDIKPANIMVNKEGVAKLADLGLARRVDAEETALTRTGTAMGTPFYMAPEQATDAKRADARSDIYSLGATWYHMIAGRPPFEGSTPLELVRMHMKEPLKPLSSVVSAAPRGVSFTIDRMMAKDPDQRIQTASELVQIIREQCMGPRDVTSELGLGQKKQPETLWDVQLSVAGRVEKRRLSLADIRTRVRRNEMDKNTPVRRAGTREAYQPAGSFRELEREFPRDYAVRAAAATKVAPSNARTQLHDLMTHYDSEKRSYKRREKMKGFLPYALELLALLVVAYLVWHFWPQISGFAGGLIHHGAPAAPAAPQG
jgi:serine/threonine protein kinase